MRKKGHQRSNEGETGDYEIKNELKIRKIAFETYNGGTKALISKNFVQKLKKVLSGYEKINPALLSMYTI